MKLNINRNKKILLGLGCILTLFVLYRYFNVVEGLSKNNIFDFNSKMNEITTQQMYYVTKYGTPEIINAMKTPLNVNKSIDVLKQAITDVKYIYTKIIDADNFSKDKKKAKKQRDGIKDAKNKADASYLKATASYEQTITDGNLLHIQNGTSMTSSEAVTYYTKKTLDSLKLARTYLDD